MQPSSGITAGRHVVRFCTLLFVTAALLVQAHSAFAQGLPEGEYYGGQTFSPTVEVLLSVGNGGLALYNGYLLYQRRRRHFAAGAAVIAGSIGLAIGLHEGANYPATDLAFGAAAIVGGGLQMLSLHSRIPAWTGASGTSTMIFMLGGGFVPGGARLPRPGLSLRLRVVPAKERQTRGIR